MSDWGRCDGGEPSRLTGKQREYIRGRTEVIEEIRASIDARLVGRGTHRKDSRWWGAFYHGLDCALTDVRTAETKGSG